MSWLILTFSYNPPFFTSHLFSPFSEYCLLAPPGSYLSSTLLDILGNSLNMGPINEFFWSLSSCYIWPMAGNGKRLVASRGVRVGVRYPPYQRLQVVSGDILQIATFFCFFAPSGPGMTMSPICCYPLLVSLNHAHLCI